MEKKKKTTILITLFEGCNFEMDATAPDLDELIKLVVKNRDEDFSNLTITCDDELFDIDAFKEAILKAIITFQQNIELNQSKLNDILKKIV